MIENYRRIFSLFDKREKRLFLLLMCIMVFVTFYELITASGLFVLLRVLAEPASVPEMFGVGFIYRAGGFETMFAFQFFFAMLVLAGLVGGIVINGLAAYAMIRFTTMRNFALSSRILESYLNQPYTWFLARNSTDVSKNVLSEVQAIVMRVITPSLRMLANLMMATAMIGFLLYLDFVVALSSAVLLGGGYTLIYVYLRKKLSKIGEILVETNRERFFLAQEATGGFKEVKLLGLEQNYVNRFRQPARRMAQMGARTQLMNQIPKLALQALTYVVLISTIMLLMVRNDGDLSAAIPTLGTFAYAVMRLLPAMQQIFGSFNSLRVGRPILDQISDDYAESQANRGLRPINLPPSVRMPLTDELELREIDYSYPETARRAVRGISLKIPARSTIGIVGGTGAGKTTLVDIILGLLTPQSGDILVDGKPLTRENIQAWRRALGYVPQSIYLTDATVAQNIAFGIAPEAIDMEAVERAAKDAALHDFVMEELPDGYDTIVGERGVRLSGGQRQRIGIARALYFDPELLILDEATSALDNLTERAVMDAVQNVRNQKTIIMIAHRLTTVRDCDAIFLLENGQVASVGTFDELVAKNETFRRMAANE